MLQLSALETQDWETYDSIRRVCGCGLPHPYFFETVWVNLTDCAPTGRIRNIAEEWVNSVNRKYGVVRGQEIAQKLQYRWRSTWL